MAEISRPRAPRVRYPFLVEELSRRGYEFAAHGTHATRMITSKMDADKERATIEEAIRAVEQCTGKRPTGWVGQDYGESAGAPALLGEAGIEYVADWPNDDQP
jgi:allantoinase